MELFRIGNNLPEDIFLILAEVYEGLISEKISCSYLSL